MSFNDELTELTPQRREEREKQEQKHREESRRRGGRMVRVMVIVYVGMQILTLTFGFAARQKEGGFGNGIITCIFQVVLVAVFARGLWLGKRWARNLFLAVLVLAMLLKAWNVLKLSLAGGGEEEVEFLVWDTGGDEADAESILEYKKEVLAQYQEEQKARAKARKLMIAAHMADILIGAGYLSILLGSAAVKEFFEGQAAFAAGDFERGG